MTDNINNDVDWVRFFGRHIVTFESIYTLPGKDGGPRTTHLWVTTAFVISLKGHWFFMTAGHVFSKIEEMRKDQGAEFGPWKLYDDWGIDSQFGDPQPVDFETMPKQILYFPEEEGWFFSGDKTGYDYAFIPVPPLVGPNLFKNNVRPLSEATWRSTFDEDCDEYWMFGFPDELNEAEYDPTNKQHHIHRRLLAADVRLLSDPPKKMLRTIPCFYGTISDTIPIEPGRNLKSIRGMSGGPIFCFKDGNYGVVAIQSTWWSDTRNILGVSMEYFGKWLERELAPYLNDAAQEMKEE